MQKVPIVAAVLAVLSISACDKHPNTPNDALAKDLAVGSANALNLAPVGPVQKTVSAIEQWPNGHPAAKQPRMILHRVAVARIEQTAPKVSIIPVSNPIPVDAPVTIAPRPRPVEISPPSMEPDPANDPMNGGSPSDWPDGGAGNIGHGVIIRGGVGDGDHCDPRGGGIRLPASSPIHGTF